jgi:ATP-dependent RNA helicase DeaD
MSKQFSDLGISAPICKALNELKIVTPTEIQQKAIPLLLANKTDVVVKTGTGKKQLLWIATLQLIDSNRTNVQAVH